MCSNTMGLFSFSYSPCQNRKVLGSFPNSSFLIIRDKNAPEDLNFILKWLRIVRQAVRKLSGNQAQLSQTKAEAGIASLTLSKLLSHLGTPQCEHSCGLTATTTVQHKNSHKLWNRKSHPGLVRLGKWGSPFNSRCVSLTSKGRKWAQRGVWLCLGRPGLDGKNHVPCQWMCIGLFAERKLFHGNFLSVCLSSGLRIMLN